MSDIFVLHELARLCGSDYNCCIQPGAEGSVAGALLGYQAGAAYLGRCEQVLM